MNATNATTTSNKPNDLDGEPKSVYLRNEKLSSLEGYGALILTVILLVEFMTRYYLLEKFIFKKVYGKVYAALDTRNKLGFTNHHIGAMCKLVVLFAGAYPWTQILSTSAEFNTPMRAGSIISMGDLLFVLTQVFSSMYIFELLFRQDISLISIAHHIGAVSIAQTAVVLGLNLEDQRDASLEFLLCMIWGAFDVLAELWPNVAMIVYRLKKENHALLAKVFLCTSLITACGTVAETIMIFVFLSFSWNKWEMSFKILTPPLHFIFMAAQLHGARILYQLHLKEKKLLSNHEHAPSGLESGVGLGLKTVTCVEK